MRRHCPVGPEMSPANLPDPQNRRKPRRGHVKHFGLRNRCATAALIDSLSRGAIELHPVHEMEVNGSLVAPLVFKTSVGLNKVPGGFDSHSPPCGPGGRGKKKKQKLLQGITWIKGLHGLRNYIRRKGIYALIHVILKSM